MCTPYHLPVNGRLDIIMTILTDRIRAAMQVPDHSISIECNFDDSLSTVNVRVTLQHVDNTASMSATIQHFDTISLDDVSRHGLYIAKQMINQFN